MLRGMLKVLFGPGTDLDSEMVQRVYAIMQHTPPEGIAGALRGMAARLDSVEALRHAGRPVTVLAGQQDQIVALNAARAMAALAGNAALTIAPDAGHMVMLEQPALTTQALEMFLRALG